VGKSLRKRIEEKRREKKGSENYNEALQLLWEKCLYERFNLG
jgi:hypothetical protein